MTGQAIATIHVVGGGSNNALLNELTARATGKAVRAGVGGRRPAVEVAPHRAESALERFSQPTVAPVMDHMQK